MIYSDLFKDVTKFAKKLPTSDYQENGKHPIIDQGQKQIAGYTDIEEGLFTDVPAIIFGDHTRAIKYINTPFFIGADGVKVIKCKDEQANYNYLYYLLSSVRIPNTGYNRHYKWLKEARLVEHTKEEQEKTVAVLSTIDNTLGLYSKQLNKLDELIKSRFVEMFGDINQSEFYPYKRVQDFTTIVCGGTPNRDNDEYWKNGHIPWVKTTELRHSEIENTEEYITEKGLTESSAKIVPPGTVLIAMYGQGKTRGMTGLLKIPASTNQACACVLPCNEMNCIYLWKYFELSYSNLRNLAKGGNQPNLNSALIKNYPVLFPPLDLQNQFADFVTQVDTTESAVNQSIEKLETLKKSLMQEYFQ